MHISPSPRVLQCASMLQNCSGGTKKKKRWCVCVRKNSFSYAKLTNAGERLLKQASWTVAAERERLGLPNDSLQVVTE